jgi:hypothetical protein
MFGLSFILKKLTYKYKADAIFIFFSTKAKVKGYVQVSGNFPYHVKCRVTLLSGKIVGICGNAVLAKENLFFCFYGPDLSAFYRLVR